MTALRPLKPAWRSVCLTLAVLALVFKVAVPAGYMIDTAADQPFALVLCTAQGPVTIQSDHPGHHGAPDAPAKAGHDAPCAFAGHGAAFVAAEPVAVAAVRYVAYAPAISFAIVEAVPGRGLTAPPLPARGPPQVA